MAVTFLVLAGFSLFLFCFLSLVVFYRCLSSRCLNLSARLRISLYLSSALFCSHSLLNISSSTRSISLLLLSSSSSLSLTPLSLIAITSSLLLLLLLLTYLSLSQTLRPQPLLFLFFSSLFHSTNRTIFAPIGINFDRFSRPPGVHDIVSECLGNR